ncbi:MAG: hypothetical protein KF799_11070 [Bdellovibrionales bacterium]|nr:hypothetical protein [Bdellovibrionales bacterium]
MTLHRLVIASPKFATKKEAALAKSSVFGDQSNGQINQSDKDNSSVNKPIYIGGRSGRSLTLSLTCTLPTLWGEINMKQRMMHIALIVLSMTALVNCSGVKFDQSKSSSAQGNPSDGKHDDSSNGNVQQPGDDGANGSINQGAGPNGGDVSNAGGPPGTPIGNGNTAAAVLPKVEFIGPPCIRLTNCQIKFKLDKAYPGPTEFNWRTDDTRFGTATAPGQPMWGKAGYHYVSTSGHVVFPAGTTEQIVYVRNINPDNVTISIGVTMTQCTYSGLYESCQKFFNP